MIQKFILPILILITVFSCKEKEQKTALAPQIKVVEVFKQDVPIYNYFVGEVFGEERLSDALRDAPRTSPQAAVNHVLEEIEAFTCGHTPYDDLTLLAAGRSGG